MIKHVVMYFLKDNSKQSRLALKEKFMSMEGNIPCLRHIEVGIDQLGEQRSCDVLLMCHFDSMDALKEYAVHPFHVGVKSYVHSVVERAVSCDYEI